MFRLLAGSFDHLCVFCTFSRTVHPIVFNNIARYAVRGGNENPVTFVVYLEAWHADIFDWLKLGKHHGKEEVRARDLSYALWTPDLFMARVETNQDWTLMCPNECPGLADVHGSEFVALYTTYEQESRGRMTNPAQKLWHAILEAQVETGMPHMLYKDACNRKSNQINLGTLRSAGHCTAVVGYTAPDEIAAGNIGSLILPAFVDQVYKVYDFARLHEVTQVVTRNLNK